MNAFSQKSDLDRLEEARQLQSWVRRYVQNRSLPMLVFLVVFALLWLSIGLPAYLGGIAFRSGHWLLGGICGLVAAAGCAATIYVSIPRWGGRRLQEFAQGFYVRVGQATITASRPRRIWEKLLPLGLVACVVTTVAFGVAGFIPDTYLQPISALYVVPFLVAVNFLIRPATGYLPLLWPALYALHAVLIVAGASIVFTPPWDFLNMLVPTVGYGLVTAAACQVYSRFALHRARDIVSHQLERGELADDGE